MSIRHVVAVLDHYPSGDARKLVLIAIAENVNEGTWVGWPSVERIAARACISERHARRIIDKLEAEGLVDVVRRRGRTRTNRYRVRLDRLLELPTLLNIKDAIDDPESGFEPVDKAVDNPSQETGHGVPVVNPDRTSSTRKQDTQMSAKPSEPSVDLHRARDVDCTNEHEAIVLRECVGDLVKRWSS